MTRFFDTLLDRGITLFEISYTMAKKVTRHIGFEWVIPCVIPYEGYLVAMQFLDLTVGNLFLFSLTLLDGSF